MTTQRERDAFEAAILAFPLETRVRGNAALAEALGPTRKRDPEMMGWVVGYDRDRLRLDIAWDEHGPHAEFLAPKYLEIVALEPAP